MTRVKGGTIHRARRKKVLDEAKGYFGSKHRLYRTAKEQLMHSGSYAYRDRKQKKRDFRKLFITRINGTLMSCNCLAISLSPLPIYSDASTSHKTTSTSLIVDFATFTIYSDNLFFALCIPGVSRKTIWPSSLV